MITTPHPSTWRRIQEYRRLARKLAPDGNIDAINSVQIRRIAQKMGITPTQAAYYHTLVVSLTDDELRRVVNVRETATRIRALGAPPYDPDAIGLAPSVQADKQCAADRQPEAATSAPPTMPSKALASADHCGGQDAEDVVWVLVPVRVRCCKPLPKENMYISDPAKWYKTHRREDSRQEHPDPASDPFESDAFAAAALAKTLRDLGVSD